MVREVHSSHTRKSAWSPTASRPSSSSSTCCHLLDVVEGLEEAALKTDNH
jgi:hypothetical protein